MLGRETAGAVGLAVTVKAVPAVHCYPEELGTGGHNAHTVFSLVLATTWPPKIAASQGCVKAVASEFIHPPALISEIFLD